VWSLFSWSHFNLKGVEGCVSRNVLVLLVHSDVFEEFIIIYGWRVHYQRFVIHALDLGDVAKLHLFWCFIFFLLVCFSNDSFLIEYLCAKRVDKDIGVKIVASSNIESLWCWVLKLHGRSNRFLVFV
jgi:hypothetical protein